MLTLCCGLFLFSIFAISFGQLIFSEHASLRRTCENSATFKQIVHTTLNECADECIRRQRCKAIMFRDIMDVCALKEYVDLAKLDKTGSLCRYIILDNVLLENTYLGACNNHTCSMNERCTDKSMNGYKCITSECDSPTEIEGAYLLSNTHDIGATNRYKCRSGYLGIGTPTITCDTEAKWTPANFTCQKLCPEPKGSYFNGDFAAVEGENWKVGTVLHFTCRNGYTSNGIKATSTCDTNGKWKPRSVACCHDNSTNYIGGVCLRPIGVGNAKNTGEVEAHCSSLGGFWQWVQKAMMNVVTSQENVEIVLQNRAKSWYKQNFKYKECAAVNGESGDVGQDIDDKLKEAVNKAWTGKKCSEAYDWLPGQPDGGSLETCLYFYPDARKYFDDVCDFDQQKVGFACGFDIPSV